MLRARAQCSLCNARMSLAVGLFIYDCNRNPEIGRVRGRPWSVGQIALVPYARVKTASSDVVAQSHSIRVRVVHNPSSGV